MSQGNGKISVEAEEQCRRYAFFMVINCNMSQC